MIGTDIPILFEDPWLLIVNKPSGLPTQPSRDPSRPNLYSLILESKRWPYIGLHHRLDVPTSGLVLLTKNRDANKGVALLFKDRGLSKRYLCLAQGVHSDLTFTVSNFLKATLLKNGKTKMRSTLSGGDRAETHFRVLNQWNDIQLLEACPLTGRMHQIRVHLAERKLPILGDALYGRIDPSIPRLMLHASELEFRHPITQKRVQVIAPLPADFNHCLQNLKHLTPES